MLLHYEKIKSITTFTIFGKKVIRKAGVTSQKIKKITIIRTAQKVFEFYQFIEICLHILISWHSCQTF